MSGVISVGPGQRTVGERMAWDLGGCFATVTVALAPAGGDPNEPGSVPNSSLFAFSASRIWGSGLRTTSWELLDGTFSPVLKSTI